jgi:D-alanyl-D-alanine carboxypeptidase
VTASSRLSWSADDGHRGELPDYTSLLVVVSSPMIAVSVILADGNKHPETVVTELITAVQPLLGN